MHIKAVNWTDAQIDRVKRIFGDKHLLYGLALVGDAKLVDELGRAIGPDYQLEALLQEMSSLPSGGAVRRFDADKAKLLYERLCQRQQGRELLRELEQDEGYLRYQERAASAASL